MGKFLQMMSQNDSNALKARASQIDTQARIAQEEIIFPVYNPWAFAYGDLSALKTAVTKA